MSSTRSDRGLLLVISGPSGAGKGTVIADLLKKTDDTFYSVSMTTRRPRPGEVDGKNYYLVSRESFEHEIETGGLLEYACYNDNYYGTPVRAVREQLEAGKNVILEIEVKGAAIVKERMPEALTIFVMPPTPEILAERLRGRQTETDEEIQNRLRIAAEEMKLAAIYDRLVVNDEVSRASDDILSIIRAERQRRMAAV